LLQPRSVRWHTRRLEPRQQIQCAPPLCLRSPLIIGPKADDATMKDFFAENLLRLVKSDKETWEKQDSTGLVRFVRMFDKFWLCVFFPASEVPMPDALLEALTKTAISVRVVDEGLVELKVPSEASSYHGPLVTRSSWVTFRGGAVASRRMMITW
jgi:hypothetical protein